MGRINMCLSAFPCAAIFFFLSVRICPHLPSSQLCTMWGWQPSRSRQTRWHHVALLGYVYLPPNMLSPSLLSMPYLAAFGGGLLAPLGISTERAAVCQPPPEPSNWAIVNRLLEEFPTQQTWLSLTFKTWKPYHRWVCVSDNPLNSLQSLQHVACIHWGKPQECGNSWVFLEGEAAGHHSTHSISFLT